MTCGHGTYLVDVEDGVGKCAVSDAAVGAGTVGSKAEIVGTPDGRIVNGAVKLQVALLIPVGDGAGIATFLLQQHLLETDKQAVPGEKGAIHKFQFSSSSQIHVYLPYPVNKVGLLHMAVLQFIPSVLGALDSAFWGTFHQTLDCRYVTGLFSVIECVPIHCRVSR
jgi:hypothetical protein